MLQLMLGINLEGYFMDDLDEVLELQSIGKYVVGLYRINKFFLSGYTAAIAFENIITFFLKQFDGDYDEKKYEYITLHDKIQKKLKILHINKKFNLEISKNELIELKRIRNHIAHGSIRQLTKNEIKDIVEFIWKVITQLIEENMSKNIYSIDIKTAQYWVREFDAKESNEKPILANQKEICDTDFNDLYEMQKKFFILAEFLWGNKRLGKPKSTA